MLSLGPTIIGQDTDASCMQTVLTEGIRRPLYTRRENLKYSAFET